MSPTQSFDEWLDLWAAHRSVVPEPRVRDTVSSTIENAAEIVGVMSRMIDIELAASRLYFRFSNCFEEQAEVRNFWFTMALDESGHADALKQARNFIEAGAPCMIAPIIDARRLSTLEKTLGEFQRAAESAALTIEKALEIAVALETSEVNDIYQQLHLSLDPRLQKAALRLSRPTQEHLGRLVDAVQQQMPCSSELIARLNISLNRFTSS